MFLQIKGNTYTCSPCTLDCYSGRGCISRNAHFERQATFSSMEVFLSEGYICLISMSLFSGLMGLLSGDVHGLTVVLCLLSPNSWIHVDLILRQ